MQERLLNLIRKSDGVILHSEGQCPYLPRDLSRPAYIVPLRVDVGRLTPQYGTGNQRPRVVHAPTNRQFKGTGRILEALERGKVKASLALDDAGSTISLGVSPTQGDAALRALERLSASGRSGFSIDDVTNVGVLEAVAGRRALGVTHADDHPRPTNGRGNAEPVESIVLTFDNHPEDPSIDASQAAAYARRMAELGFDTSHRPIDTVRRGTDGKLERTHAHVAGVSYLERERESFLDASAVAIHELGIPARKVPSPMTRARSRRRQAGC